MKPVVYLSSSGNGTPHLKSVVGKYLQMAHVDAGKTVRVLAFRDANPEKHPWEDQDIYKSLKTCLHELGHKVKSEQYELFLQKKFDVPQFNKLLEGLTSAKRGVIVVVYGGNTWRVAAAFAQLPGLRNLLHEKVTRGEVMYVSFSAGTVLAGPSVALARDDQGPVKEEGARVANDGLGLVPYALRPHAQSPSSKDAGKSFADKMAAGSIKKDDGTPIQSCPVKYIKDGEAGLWFDGKWFELPSQSDRFERESTRPPRQSTRPPQQDVLLEKQMSPEKRLTASFCNKSISVFWPGDGKIHEMHWGDHNGWKAKVDTYDQPSVSKSTALACAKRDAGGNVCWPGEGKMYELHWGDHNGWQKELTVRNHKTISKSTVLTASFCNNSISVFWPGDGKIHEMHWGDHNGWNAKVDTYDQPSVSKSTVLACAKRDAGGNVCWPGEGNMYELHWGDHNGWQKELAVRSHSSISKGLALTASFCNKSISVFWPGDGKIHEMHWGDHNGWNAKVDTYDQPSVSKSTVLACAKRNAGGNVCWPGEGKIYELHWGDHNGWQKELTERSVGMALHVEGN